MGPTAVPAANYTSRVGLEGSGPGGVRSASDHWRAKCSNNIFCVSRLAEMMLGEWKGADFSCKLATGCIYH